MARSVVALVAILNIALAVFAISVLRQDVANSDIILVGQRLNAQQVPPDAVLKVASSSEMENLLSTCRTDILRFGLGTHLVSLDIANAKGDAAQLQRYMQSAQTFIAHMERCNPANGDVWLRDAVLSRAAGSRDRDAFHSKVMLSAALIPSYGHEVLARLNLWSGMSQQELKDFDDIVVADLSIGLHYFDGQQARQLLTYTPENLKPYMTRALGLVPKARIAQLIAR